MLIQLKKSGVQVLGRGWINYIYYNILYKYYNYIKNLLKY